MLAFDAFDAEADVYCYCVANDFETSALPAKMAIGLIAVLRITREEAASTHRHPPRRTELTACGSPLLELWAEEMKHDLRRLRMNGVSPLSGLTSTEARFICALFRDEQRHLSFPC